MLRVVGLKVSWVAVGNPTLPLSFGGLRRSEGCVAYTGVQCLGWWGQGPEQELKVGEAFLAGGPTQAKSSLPRSSQKPPTCGPLGLGSCMGLPKHLFSSPRCLVGDLRCLALVAGVGRLPGTRALPSVSLRHRCGQASGAEAVPTRALGGIPLARRGLRSTWFPIRDSLGTCSGCQCC